MKEKFETEQTKGASTCRGTLWWNISVTCGAQSTYTFRTTLPHVSWIEDFYSSKKMPEPAAAFCGETQVFRLDILHLKAWWPEESKTYTYRSRPWGLMKVLVRTVLTKWNPQRFEAHLWRFGIFLTKIRKHLRNNRLLAGQAWFKCTYWTTNTHGSILSSPPSVPIPPVVRNLLLTAPAVCLVFMSNVSVAGNVRKPTSIDWKTIQFSLAFLAPCCGLSQCFVAGICGVEAAATWPVVMCLKSVQNTGLFSM